MSQLDRAFEFADKIQNSNHFESTRFNYLTLECLGNFPTHDDGSRWAASFDGGLESEWYENFQIVNYPTAARAATPEDAIFRAVEKFCILTGFQYVHCNPAFVPTGPDDWCSCPCHQKEMEGIF